MNDIVPTPPSPSGGLKVGFLGAGYILHAHAKAVAAIPGLQLHAVCDQSLARAREAASSFGIAHACASVEELIAARCDVVHVLLPPHLHAGAARQLLEAGVHVLLEKPMAVSEAECRALAALAEARGLRLGVGHNFLFLPGHERLREAVRSGEIGRVDHVSVDWLCVLPQLKFGPFDGWMLRDPGNLMLEVGPHLAAFALDLVGGCDRVQGVAAHPLDLPGGARAWRRWTVAGEGGGSGFTLNLSLTPGEPLRRVTVRGLAGVATLDFLRDVCHIERVAESNAAIDNLRHGLRSAGSHARQALANAGKSIAGTVRKTPMLDPYRESIFRCAQAFYADFAAPLDRRATGAFGTEVIRLCEQAIATSGVQRERRGAVHATTTAAGATATAATTGATAAATGGGAATVETTQRAASVDAVRGDGASARRGAAPSERVGRDAAHVEPGADDEVATLAPPPAQPAARGAPAAARRTTALVVGGTGFIGKPLVRELLAAGQRVRVLTRGLGAASAELGGLDVELVQGSHGDAATARRAVEGVDVVYHLAKATGERWDDYLRNDVEPTRVLAEAALAAGVRRFVYTGTIDSHASADPGTTIGADTPLDARIAQRNLYARSKAACEALLLAMHRERGLPLVVLRPGIVIGAGAPPAHWGVGMFHSETRVELWGEGTHPLPFVLVGDVAKALRLAGEKPGIEGRAFLLTDDPLLSARDYVDAVTARSQTRLDVRPTSILRHFLRDFGKQGIKQLIRHPNRREAHLHDWACRSHRARYDNRATREVLGWQPAGTRERLLRDGVHASVDWYLE